MFLYDSIMGDGYGGYPLDNTRFPLVNDRYQFNHCIINITERKAKLFTEEVIDLPERKVDIFELDPLIKTCKFYDKFVLNHIKTLPGVLMYLAETTTIPVWPSSEKN